MTKATAISPANIAFIKFWGKKDSNLNIPFNNSLSMNLSNCLTTTTVEFSPRFAKDRVFLNKQEVEDEKKARVVKIIDLVREKSNVARRVKVVSRNNFPSDAGIASSASAFSALALASSSAAGLNLSLKDLSILARLGSGSAARSVVDGFAEWLRGKDSNSSYAVQIAPAKYWDLRDIVVVVEEKKKKKSSTEGHAIATTSPFYKTRQRLLNKRIKMLKDTIRKRNFRRFGAILEEEAIELHLIAMTSKPPIFYWNKGTIEVIGKVKELREKGISAYFTMDAGPNVHVFCLAKEALRVNRALRSLPGVLFVIVNKPTRGTRLVKRHLY